MSANGNGHSSNGNGHSPPFRLAPIESPEEEARGLVLKEIAPQIRRRVREDSRLSPGAKYFFNCLFDDCFWHQAGGHGTGQIYADVRDLGERYQAWPDTITRWRDELAEAGWLWTKYAWPMTEWRLTPLMPAPANSPHKKAVQMSLGRAAAKGVGEIRTSSKNGQPVVSAEEKGNSHSARTEKTVSASASSPPSVGKKPLARTEDAGESVGKIRTGEG